MRTELGIFNAPSNQRIWKNISSEHFLAKCNSVVSTHQWVRPLKTLARAGYVCENDLSSVITEFKFDNAGLGNKAPRVGYPRKPFCPLCPVKYPNSEFHLLFTCGSVSQLRQDTGIMSFINICLLKEISLETAYTLYVNGEDFNENPVTFTSYLERGKCMDDMRQLWLSKW